MSATLDPLTAGEVYVQALEPRPRRRAGRVVAGALDLWCATTGGRFELTSAGQVVVRRRSDGVVELTIPAGGTDAAAALLDLVREQLETLSPDEFREAWAVGGT
ncbi:MAG: hypothetical protein WKF79_05160 [Nocardioides sp.]